jgi:hypothetical protein
MVHIKDISDEPIILVLEYLRATDLASCSEVDKSVFKRSRIMRAISFQMTSIYPTMLSPTKNPAPQEPWCDALYVREVKSILAAISSPQPTNGRGYWVSASWLTNAKKYYEALQLPEVGKKAGAKKQTKIRLRRGSDALPPWPIMNNDITCPHGTLAITKGPRAKKRLLDGRSWFLLRKFYPAGPQFKSTVVCECIECVSGEEEAKASASEKRESELRSRRSGLASGPLEAVAARKAGIPAHLLTARMIPVYEADELELSVSFSPPTTASILPEPFQAMSDAFESMEASDIDAVVRFALDLPPGVPIPSSMPFPYPSTPDAAAGAGGGGGTGGCALPIPRSPRSQSPRSPTARDQYMQPLLPGLYNLVPRRWLKVWRQYVKDPTGAKPPPLDCTCMLCHDHGLLIVPPHVEEYIVGVRKSLLSGLGSYPGEVLEILSAEEWEALIQSLKSLADFSVRFCLDGENISWNIGVCTRCSPFDYGPMVSSPARGRFSYGR